MINMSKIQQMKSGQVFLIIPKKVFDGMGWSKRMEVSWEIMGKDKLKIERVKNNPPEITGGIYT